MHTFTYMHTCTYMYIHAYIYMNITYMAYAYLYYMHTCFFVTLQHGKFYMHDICIHLHTYMDSYMNMSTCECICVYNEIHHIIPCKYTSHTSYYTNTCKMCVCLYMCVCICKIHHGMHLCTLRGISHTYHFIQT